MCINFADALGTCCGHADLSSAAVVHQIFTAERDQTLCHSMQRASLRRQQSPSRQPDCVLGVVGVAHIPGIVHCWEAEIGNSMAGVNKQFSVTDLHQKAVLVEDAEAQGVRRALLETFLGLSCSPAVCADMQRHLPVLPSEAEEAYACTRELYGSPRMLLAALPREHLDKVSHLLHLNSMHALVLQQNSLKVICLSCLTQCTSLTVFQLHGVSADISWHRFFPGLSPVCRPACHVAFCEQGWAASF